MHCVLSFGCDPACLTLRVPIHRAAWLPSVVVLLLLAGSLSRNSIGPAGAEKIAKELESNTTLVALGYVVERARR